MAVPVEQARALALALPEAVEADHHGRPSFRVGGKIFATLWTGTRMNVMLDEGGILTAVGADPGTCSPVPWGKRLAAVAVDLRRVEPDVLADLLRDAWRGKHRSACCSADRAGNVSSRRVALRPRPAVSSSRAASPRSRLRASARRAPHPDFRSESR